MILHIMFHSGCHYTES